MRPPKPPDSLSPLLAFAAAVLAWELGVRVAGVRPDVLPGPLVTARSFGALLVDGTLLKHAVASLYRVTLGFYLAVLLAVPAGMALGWWKGGQRAFAPLINFLRPISPLAWIPLAMLWFGIGDRPAVFLIFLASFFTVIVSTISAVNDIPGTYFQVAANFAFTPLETVRYVIFPAILPRVVPALRIGAGVAWLVVVAAEMIAVKSGLGFLVLDARNALRTDHVVCAMAGIGAIGVVIDAVIQRLGQAEPLAWGLGR